MPDAGAPDPGFPLGPTVLALLDRPDGGWLFLRPEGPVGADAFLRDAQALAAVLPPGGPLLNLCADRYRFAVAFAAGLIARRTSLLNLSQDAAARLYPDHVAVGDDAAPPPFVGPTPNPTLPAAHPAAIVFTSGSTGQPTGHPKSWGALVDRSRAAARQFGFAGGPMINAPMINAVVGAVPPQHMYGFETTVLLPLHAPVASWCGAAFFPADVAAALGACSPPRTLVATPLLLRTLLLGGSVLPLEGVVSATAPLEPALAAEAEAAWNAPVREIFGATECGSIASRRPTADEAWRPYPGIELRADDASAVVHAPFMPPVPLADVLEPAPRPDAPGAFRLLGRRTDVVKRGGRRASLQGLTEALLRLPGVRDGTFVLPDAPGNEASARLIAVVVAPDRDGREILAGLRGTIDPLFLPRRVVRVDALPRNALGKLPRRALLDLLDAAAP